MMQNYDKQILIAEDDAHILEGLRDTLETEGYAVVTAEDGRGALDACRKEDFDLIILDVMMPEVSGYDVCRSIRKKDEVTPIIMLTAKGEEIDKVVGLQLGADDYVTKPFGIRELVARIEAVLRRSKRRPTAESDILNTLPKHFLFGTAEVNSTTYKVSIEGRSSKLTPRELALIEHFYERPGRVISREELLREVWGVDYTGTTRTLDQHIAQLRKKIEADPHHPAALTTVHGLGYRYEPADEDE